MNKKAMEATVLVLIILVVIVILSTTWLFFRTWQVADSLPADILQCRQSAITSLQVSHQNSLVDTTRSQADDFLAYVCPARFEEIAVNDLQSTVLGENQRLYEQLNYDSKEQYNLDLKIWNHVNSCYSKLFYGQTPLFDHSFFSSGQKTFCVVCSVLEFEEDVATELGEKQDFAGLWFLKKDPLTKFTLQEHQNDHPDKALGVIDVSYSPIGTQAVVYKRTNVDPNLNRVLDSVNSVQSFFTNIIDGPPSIIIETREDGTKQTKLSRNDEFYPLTDIETIEVIDYSDPISVARECDYIKAEVDI